MKTQLIPPSVDERAALRLRTKMSRIAKYEGDDIYSWALFINGRVAYNGMSRDEATWRRKRYIAEGEL